MLPCSVPLSETLELPSRIWSLRSDQRGESHPAQSHDLVEQPLLGRFGQQLSQPSAAEAAGEAAQD